MYESQRGRVKSAEPQGCEINGGQQRFQAFLHFRGRGTCEGHGQNIRGRDALRLNERRDFVSEGVRFAGARTGDDDQRTVGMMNNAVLFVI